MNEELFQPSWRDTKSYAAALCTDDAMSAVKSALLKNRCESDGVRYGATPREEIDQTLPWLLKRLRLFSVDDFAYWMVSFLCVFGYFLLEAIFIGIWIFEGSDKASLDFLKPAVYILVGSAVVLFSWLVLMTFYFYAEFVHNPQPSAISKVLSRLPKLHTVPLFITTVCLVWSNLYLVLRTGGNVSPFMPSLTFVAISLIAAPRDNNWGVVILNILACVAIVFPFVWSVDPPVAISPDIARLAVLLNGTTLFFNILSRYVQRRFGAIRVAK